MYTMQTNCLDLVQSVKVEGLVRIVGAGRGNVPRSVLEGVHIPKKGLSSSESKGCLGWALWQAESFLV